jgi:hypothetical protein
VAAAGQRRSTPAHGHQTKDQAESLDRGSLAAPSPARVLACRLLRPSGMWAPGATLRRLDRSRGFTPHPPPRPPRGGPGRPRDRARPGARCAQGPGTHDAAARGSRRSRARRWDRRGRRGRPRGPKPRGLHEESETSARTCSRWIARVSTRTSALRARLASSARGAAGDLRLRWGHRRPATGLLKRRTKPCPQTGFGRRVSVTVR